MSTTATQKRAIVFRIEAVAVHCPDCGEVCESPKGSTMIEEDDKTVVCIGCGGSYTVSPSAFKIKAGKPHKTGGSGENWDMIRMPYCLKDFAACKAILEGCGWRTRERSYVDEEFPNALLIAFDPALPTGRNKVAVSSLEDIQALAQRASDRFFERRK